MSGVYTGLYLFPTLFTTGRRDGSTSSARRVSVATGLEMLLENLFPAAAIALAVRPGLD
jgi:hypothetical protein